MFVSPAARHALSRLPENLLVLPLSQALSSLVMATTNREHAKVYDEASNLLSLVAQPDFPDQELASAITSLLTAFFGNTLEHFYLLLKPS
jgi:COP9 signalosome complex subunit 8